MFILFGPRPKVCLEFDAPALAHLDLSHLIVSSLPHKAPQSDCCCDLLLDVESCVVCPAQRSAGRTVKNVPIKRFDAKVRSVTQLKTLVIRLSSKQELTAGTKPSRVRGNTESGHGR